MIKMTRHEPDGKTSYWEVWQDGKELTIHQGTVGDTGESWEIRVAKKDAEVVMASLAREKEVEGYAVLEPQTMHQLVLQYKINGWGISEDLDKRSEIMELMDECLDGQWPL